MQSPDHKNKNPEYRETQLRWWVELFGRGVINVIGLLEGLSLAENDPKWKKESKTKEEEEEAK